MIFSGIEHALALRATIFAIPDKNQMPKRVVPLAEPLRRYFQKFIVVIWTVHQIFVLRVQARVLALSHIFRGLQKVGKFMQSQ
jgi:hypothetical protein